MKHYPNPNEIKAAEADAIIKMLKTGKSYEYIKRFYPHYSTFKISKVVDIMLENDKIKIQNDRKQTLNH